jgi:PIN domain nuclease of toxin-antitoxin system
VVVLWEVADLAQTGVIRLPACFDHWYRGIEGKAGFVLESLSPDDVNEARQLPFRDPFDPLIAGTAIRLGYPLITRDQPITDSGLLQTIW